MPQAYSRARDRTQVVGTSGAGPPAEERDDARVHDGADPDGAPRQRDERRDGEHEPDHGDEHVASGGVGAHLGGLDAERVEFVGHVHPQVGPP